MVAAENAQNSAKVKGKPNTQSSRVLKDVNEDDVPKLVVKETTTTIHQDSRQNINKDKGKDTQTPATGQISREANTITTNTLDDTKTLGNAGLMNDEARLSPQTNTNVPNAGTENASQIRILPGGGSKPKQAIHGHHQSISETTDETLKT